MAANRENILEKQYLADEKKISEFYNDEKLYPWSFDTLKGYINPLDKRRLEKIVDLAESYHPQKNSRFWLWSGNFYQSISQRWL